MNKAIKVDSYSPQEERANVLTHVPGIILGIFGVIYTLRAASSDKEALGLIIFFLTVILLYSCSSLYHWVTEPQRKRFYKMLDHIAIYFLIAGTFTPFCIVVLSDEKIGQQLIWAVWAITLLGTLFKIFFTGRFQFISLASYLAMGWLGFLMFDKLGELLGPQSVNLILYGGICYTTGVAFYVWKSLKYHHAIWHLFVLAGTVFHALAIIRII
jgi:hemolysin III